jgi:hypothetical protein
VNEEKKILVQILGAGVPLHWNTRDSVKSREEGSWPMLKQRQL